MSLIPELIEIYRGLPFGEDETWELRDEDDKAINLTGCTLEAVLFEKTGAEPVAFAVTITDAPNGAVKMVLTSDQTRALAPTIMHWNLTLTDSNGAKALIALGPVRIVNRS